MTRNGMEKARLLVVSQDPGILRPLWSMGELNSWQLETVVNAWDAIDRVQSGIALDLLLLDVPRGDADGLLHILRWMRRLRPILPIVLIADPYDEGKRQESMRMGARDYLIRPIAETQLETAIQRNLAAVCEPLDAEIASEDVEQVSTERFFIGVGTLMRKVRAQAALLAEADVPVLILGEDGSGKETIARLIHRLSVRSGFEFASVNCAALPGNLLECELFGYQRNGTAAPPRIRTGKMENCARGAIFLDKITEMPANLQDNLLDVVENKRFLRPGSSSFVDTDVRVVAACSMDIEYAVAENRLRQDLHQRLSAYTIHVPPLRERKEELPILARHFMHRIAKHYGLVPRELSPEILEAWQAYNWPGNLRELERCVKRYLMVGDEELSLGKGAPRADADPRQAVVPIVQSGAAPAALPGQQGASPTASKSLRTVVQTVKREAERNAIAAALERTGWNRKAAARLLKVSYRTVLYKIEQYKMTPTNSSVYRPGNGNGNGANGFSHNGKAS